ncbi:Cof-type HAD-IIB family hydrolase [Bacillus sp. FJAT-47783]|uniref:Cof-type HAD-IIB family hydrolase n=1 Tax=Bacillus sp. FJAT-47783 TaxID=2922712 RepID=UPI001FAC09EB|nr:Cof-type HAD-IIB family hydrolase [Bacillus sp. FJAT-47783]
MKCFSIDLDGTLLNSQHEISDENLAVLRELKEEGHTVILNTGRAFPDVMKIEAVKQLEIPIFCVNGSVLYSEKRELMYEATIDVKAYKEIFTTLMKLNVGVLVYTNEGGLPSTLPPLHSMNWDEIEKMFRKFNYESILNMENLKIYKLIALVHHDNLEKIKEVKDVLRKRDDISIASSFPNNVEITSGEAHKGKAILRYQNMKSLSFDEIYAFGDGGNDLGQFEVATTKIAMENAPQEIKDHADYITKSNDENGFAYAVKELLKVGIKSHLAV